MPRDRPAGAGTAEREHRPVRAAAAPHAQKRGPARRWGREPHVPPAAARASPLRSRVKCVGPGASFKEDSSRKAQGGFSARNLRLTDLCLY